MPKPLPIGLRPNSALASDSRFVALLEGLEAEDLGRIMKRIMQKCQISDSEANLCKDQFLRFFALSSHCLVNLAPDKQIDAFWHEFILFTQEYAAFCQRHRGRFFHHTPFDDETPSATIAATMDAMTLIRQHFSFTATLAVQHSSGCASGG